MMRSHSSLCALLLLCVSPLVSAQDARPNNAQPISVGDSITGTLPGGTDGDRYSLSLAEPTWLDITQFSDGIDCLLRIVDEQGTLIAENDDFGGELNSRIQRLMPAGQYIIVASAYNTDAGGDYTVQVAPWVAQTVIRVPMHPEAVAEVTLNAVEGADSIAPLSLSFEVDALRPYVVPFTLPDGNWQVALLGPDGATIGNDAFGAGEHEISMLPDWLGEHTLTIVPTGDIAGPATFAAGPPVSRPAPTIETLQPGSYDVQLQDTDVPAFGEGLARTWAIPAAAGTTVRIETTSDDVGVSLRLRGGAADSIASDDGSGATQVHAVSLGNPLSLTVSATSAGSVQLSVTTERSPRVQPATARLRRALSGSWSEQPRTAAGEQAAVAARIDLDSGVYTVEGSCDELIAIRPTGEVIHLAEATCLGTLVADIAGSWTLIMRSADLAGDFSMVVLPSDGRPMNLGELDAADSPTTRWIADSLSSSSIRTPEGVLADDYEFSLAGDARLLIGMGAAGVDGYLELFANGELVAANDDSAGIDPRLVQNLPAGDYTLRVREYALAEGPYKVWIEATPARTYPTAQVAVGQTTRVEFARTQATIADIGRQGVRMRVIVSAPGVYRIAVDGHDMDPVAVLRNGLGEQVQLNDDRAPGNLNPEIVAPLAAGEYILEVYGYDDRLTSVDVSVTSVD